MISKPLHPEPQCGAGAVNRAGPSSCSCHLFLSEPYSHASAPESFRRKETILVIRLIEDVLDSTKQHQRHALGLSSFVTHKQVALRVATESKLRHSKRKIVFEDRRQVRSGTIQIEAEEQRAISLRERQPKQVFWYYVLRQQSLTNYRAIAVGESVRDTHVHSLEWCGVEVSLDSAREPARSIFKTAETSQPERIYHKSRKGNYSLQARVKVCRAKQHAIVSKSLIETTISADRLFRFQSRIAKSNHPCRTEVSLTESLKQRRRAKTIAYVRSQLSARAANEVCDRTVTGRGALGFATLQNTWSIRTPDAIPLATHTNRETQSIVKKRQLVLPENSSRSLTVGGVVEKGKRRRRALEQRYTLAVETCTQQIRFREVEIHATIDCVDVAVVDVLKLEITKRNERRESRIHCWSIVVAPIARDPLVRN